MVYAFQKGLTSNLMKTTQNLEAGLAAAQSVLENLDQQTEGMRHAALDPNQDTTILSDDEFITLLTSALNQQNQDQKITFTSGYQTPVFNPAGATVWPVGYSVTENGRSMYGGVLSDALKVELGTLNEFLMDCQTYE